MNAFGLHLERCRLVSRDQRQAKLDVRVIRRADDWITVARLLIGKAIGDEVGASGQKLEIISIP